MATLQIRNLPDDLYQALVRKAGEERRSVSQQAIVELSRNLQLVVDARARRKRILTEIRKSHPGLGKRLPDPVKLIREDRDR
jgi:plasmid stability protein